MGVRIGLVGQRADLAVEVGALAAQVGAEVVSLSPADLARDGASPGAQVDLVAVDAAGLGAGGIPESVGRDGAHVSFQPGWSGGASGPGPQLGPPTVPVGLAGPDIPPIVVLCRPGEADRARSGAEALGCQHVVELPLGGPWLLEQMAPSSPSGVLAVVGAVGGVGATTVAIAGAFGAGVDCLLVDADPNSPGLDLPLGIAEGTGARWPEIPDTAAPLDPATVRAALPTLGGVAVLTLGGPGGRAGSTGGSGVHNWGPGAGQLAAVMGVARSEFRRTVVDAGRGPLPAGLLGPGDAVALVVPATVAGVVAGRRALARIDVGTVLVLLRPTGWLPAHEVRAQLGVAVVLELPRLRRAPELSECGDLLSGRTGRCLRALGEQVWGEVR